MAMMHTSSSINNNKNNNNSKINTMVMAYCGWLLLLLSNSTMTSAEQKVSSTSVVGGQNASLPWPYVAESRGGSNHKRWIQQQRIVGGKPVVSADGAASFAFPAGTSLCGATVIHPDVLLSAAHCVGAFVEQGVLIGGTQISGSDVDEVLGVVFERVHPQYQPGTELNDIMLVKLDRSSDAPLVRYNVNASIPFLDVLASDQNHLHMIGFGRDSTNGQYAETLQQVTVTLVANEECAASLRAQGFVVDTTTMLCTSTRSGNAAVGSCDGDSGGPVLETATGVQVGIVSWGNGVCGDPDSPDVNVRVSAYADWIFSSLCCISNVPPANCPPDIDCTTIAPAAMTMPSQLPSLPPSSTSTPSLSSKNDSDATLMLIAPQASPNTTNFQTEIIPPISTTPTHVVVDGAAPGGNAMDTAAPTRPVTSVVARNDSMFTSVLSQRPSDPPSTMPIAVSVGGSLNNSSSTASTSDPSSVPSSTPSSRPSELNNTTVSGNATTTMLTPSTQSSGRSNHTGPGNVVSSDQPSSSVSDNNTSIVPSSSPTNLRGSTNSSTVTAPLASTMSPSALPSLSPGFVSTATPSTASSRDRTFSPTRGGATESPSQVDSTLTSRTRSPSTGRTTMPSMFLSKAPLVTSGTSKPANVPGALPIAGGLFQKLTGNDSPSSAATDLPVDFPVAALPLIKRSDEAPTLIPSMARSNDDTISPTRDRQIEPSSSLPRATSTVAPQIRLPSTGRPIEAPTLVPSMARSNDDTMSPTRGRQLKPSSSSPTASKPWTPQAKPPSTGRITEPSFALNSGPIDISVTLEPTKSPAIRPVFDGLFQNQTNMNAQSSAPAKALVDSSVAPPPTRTPNVAPVVETTDQPVLSDPNKPQVATTPIGDKPTSSVLKPTQKPKATTKAPTPPFFEKLVQHAPPKPTLTMPPASPHRPILPALMQKLKGSAPIVAPSSTGKAPAAAPVKISEARPVLGKLFQILPYKSPQKPTPMATPSAANSRPPAAAPDTGSGRRPVLEILVQNLQYKNSKKSAPVTTPSSAKSKAPAMAPDRGGGRRPVLEILVQTLQNKSSQKSAPIAIPSSANTKAPAMAPDIATPPVLQALIAKLGGLIQI